MNINFLTMLLAIIVMSPVKNSIAAQSLMGNPTNSSITIKSGDSYGHVYGGYNNTTDIVGIHSNTVTMTGGTVERIYSGRTVRGDIYDNNITISGGTVSYINGSMISNGTDSEIRDNTIIIKGNATVTDAIWGGFGDRNAVISNNVIEIQGGTVKAEVIAGYGDSTESTLSGNKVIVSGGNISGNIIGGTFAFKGSQSGNVSTNSSIKVTNGTVTGDIYGDYYAATSGSKVEISGGTVNNVYGSYECLNTSMNGAQRSEVIISGGIINGIVSGSGSDWGGVSESNYNSITIKGGTILGNIYGGSADNSKYNTIKLYGGTLSNIYGARDFGSNNMIEILGNITAGHIAGVEVGVNSKNSTGNILKLNGHRLTASSVNYFNDYQFILPTVMTADQSAVTITGTEYTDMSNSTVSILQDPGHLLDDRNVVVLIDKATGSFQETIFNGVIDVTPVSVLVRDDQLIATYDTQVGEPGEKGEPGDKGETGDKGPDGDKGETGDKGPDGDKGETGDKGPDGDKGDTGDKGPDGDKGETGDKGLDGDKGETGDKGPDGEKGDIGDKGPDGDKGETGDKGPDGDKGETGDKGPDGDKGETGDKGPDGDKGETGDKGPDGDKGEPGDYYGPESDFTKAIRRQTKTLSYSILGQVGLLNNSLDMVIGSAFDRAAESLRHVGPGTATGFVVSGYWKDKYKTDSHIDVKGYSFLAGMAYAPHSMPSATFGVFAEYGKGNTGGNNGFGLTSEGDNRFAGGGILARFDDLYSTGIYFESTARAGRSNVKFAADGFLANASGETKSVRYDIKSSYHSFHLGFGRIIPVTCNVSVDASLKYLWTRQNGKGVVAAGEELNLSGVSSHRVRAGARVRYSYNQNMSFFGGAWVEREFAGTSSITSVASNKRFEGGKLKGNTLLIEAGIGFGGDSRWHFDLGVNGHVGRRRGIGGNAAVSVSF